MTLTPQFLTVGSIVEYNIGTLKEPEYISTTLDAVDLQSLEADPEDFNYWHRPIELTPEILTEWCGFERFEHTYHLNGFNIDLKFQYCMIDGDGYCVYERYCEPIQYLHELQLLFLGFKTVLPITIK